MKQMSAPLIVPFTPNPLAIERTLAKFNCNGNGSNGHLTDDNQEAKDPEAIGQKQEHVHQTTNTISTSPLSNVLGAARSTAGPNSAFSPDRLSILDSDLNAQTQLDLSSEVSNAIATTPPTMPTAPTSLVTSAESEGYIPGVVDTYINQTLPAQPQSPPQLQASPQSKFPATVEQAARLSEPSDVSGTSATAYPSIYEPPKPPACEPLPDGVSQPTEQASTGIIDAKLSKTEPSLPPPLAPSPFNTSSFSASASVDDSLQAFTTSTFNPPQQLLNHLIAEPSESVLTTEGTDAFNLWPTTPADAQPANIKPGNLLAKEVSYPVPAHNSADFFADPQTLSPSQSQTQINTNSTSNNEMTLARSVDLGASIEQATTQDFASTDIFGQFESAAVPDDVINPEALQITDAVTNSLAKEPAEFQTSTQEQEFNSLSQSPQVLQSNTAPSFASFDFFSDLSNAASAQQAISESPIQIGATNTSAPSSSTVPGDPFFAASSSSNSGGDFFNASPTAPSGSETAPGALFTLSSQTSAIQAAEIEFSSTSQSRQHNEADPSVDKDGFPDGAANRKQSTAIEPTPVPKRLRETATGEDKLPAKEASEKSFAKYLQYVEGDIDLLGRTVPKKFALVGAVVAVVIGLQILGFIGSTVGKIFGGAHGGMQKASASPSLSGSWEFAFMVGNQPHQGAMTVLQQGNHITGEGRDDAYFVVEGSFDPPKLQFNKQYVVDGRPTGKPVIYQGNVEARSGGPYVHGIYIAKLKKGIFYNAREVEVRNWWEAQLTEPASNSGQAGVGTGNQPEVQDYATKQKKFQSFCLSLAFGILAIGGLLAMASLKLFGPAGLINIWAKKDYIPSQFKSQHNKMVSELGKPIRPGGLPLGLREEWGIHQFWMPKELALTPELRDANPHMLVIGAGAKGKTRLMANQIVNDIQSNDRAVVVIDSDGGLVDLITRWVASQPKGKEFTQRISVIDPTCKGNCPAYNPLEEPEDGDLQAAASAVVFGFKAIYTEPPGSQSQWNQQTANILRNSALLLMVNGKTLTDLPTLLSDNDFRDVLLEKVEKRKQEKVEFITLLETWGQYKRLARTDQWINWVEPILNRVSPMLSDPRIRPILTKPKGDLSFSNIINEGKVLLVKIPQGQLDQNANLLGSLIVTGLKQAALSIASRSTRRHPCALYLDEFDNFIEKETLDAITSETKKFQIGFNGAVKSLQHLPEDFRNQLIINVGTLCAFSLAKKDADMLGPQMFRVDGRKIKHQTITNIFNKVNSSPQFELISDEEKLNIDRLVGQEERTYFCYRVGTVAGVFHLKAPEFRDIPDKDVNWTISDEMYGNESHTDRGN